MSEDPERVLFRVLGPFEVVVDGLPAPLGGARQRLVLAGLVANANAVVSSDRLIDIVWGDEPPATALSTLQKYVHRHRALVGDRLLTRAPGYLLRIDAGQSDASRFESLLADATRLSTAGELSDAIAAFDAALGMWRGEAWAEFADFDFARAEVSRLDSLRATAIEDRMEVALAAGRHAEVIGELEATVVRYPLRERPRAQLMLALYRSGRHADAVRAYDVFRRYLGEEVGLDPSASLARLGDAVLLQKPELDWVPPPGARGRPALPSGVVTFLFSDIEGSTRLFRQLGHGYVDLLERHRRLVRAAVATAGGVEVNSEGDGLFFAFSSPAAGLAASIAAQRALVGETWPPGAEVRVRMGLHTGEASPRDGDYIALAVHQAARVKDAAHGGQVLLSAATVASIDGHVPADSSVFGLGAFPLRDFDGGVELYEARHPSLPSSFPPPRVDVGATPLAPLPAALAADAEPLIGRSTELEWLEVLWQRAAGGDRVAALVYGPPGIGKSRLLAEFARRAHAGGARVTVSTPDAQQRGNEPVLAVLDDFDGTTMDVLGPGGSGVLVIAATHQPIAGTLNTRELEGLSSDEVGLLLAHKIETVPLELSGAIHTETQGNPGLVHDVARRLRDREAEERVQRALERVGAATQEARALRDAIAGGVLERERLAVLAPDAAVRGLCPYKGLARYEAADAPFFYGRERLVATLVARIAVDRFVGIIGASGSGKSSLVRAGLLPSLSGRALPGSDAWPTCTFTPGEHPLRSFAQALAPLVGVPAPELARRLDRQPDELGAVLDAGLRGRDGARVVVVVDQFEEIVTLCRDQEERERFAGALVDAVTDPDVRAVVVPVVRADYYGALAVHPELAHLFEQSQLLVGAMTDAELRRAITEPAHRAGLVLEDGLVDAVCADAGSEPGALPLVSTAMAETWVRRDATTLTLAAYREAGGVHGALARLADDVYAGLDDGGQALARSLFLRLAEPGEGTDDVRRRMPRQELGGGPAGDDVLDAFVGRRLLVADGSSVEVAHEALLREWPRLRTWLEEDREGRRLHRQLTEAAAAWAAEGRDPGVLYRGARLGAAQDWAASHPDILNAAEREFLDASSAARQDELLSARRTARRSRALAGAMAVFLVVALVAGGLALVQRSRANQQAATARRAAAAANTARGTAEGALVVSDATRLATQTAAVPSDQLDLALLLAAQSRRLDESTTTDGALEQVLSHVRGGLDRQINVHAITKFCTDASPDGRLVAAGGADRVILYNATSGLPVRSLPANLGAYACAQFSADSTRLVAGGANGDVYVWDVASGRQLGTTIHLPGQNPFVFFAVFAGDNRVVTATYDGVITVWDITDLAHPAAIGAPYATTSVGAVPNDQTLVPHPFVQAGSDLLAFAVLGRTEVWHISSHTLAYPSLPGRAAGETPDGSTLATTVGGQVLFWDAATGQPRGRPLDGFIAAVDGFVLFSPDGRRAAIQSGPTVTVFDRQSGAPVGDPIAGETIRYLDDGRLVVGNGQTVQLWRTDNLAPVAFATALDASHGLGLVHWLSPATVYGIPLSSALPGPPLPGTLEWDASTGNVIGDLLGRALPPTPTLPINTIVNPAGTYAAFADGDTIDLWDIGHHNAASLLQTGQSQPIATWDPAAPILATTGLGGTLALWDVADAAHPTLLHRLSVSGYSATGPSPTEPIARFSPDGHTVALLPAEFPTSVPGITLVSAPDARVQRTLPTGPSASAVFASDSRTLVTTQASYSTVGQVSIWDAATGSRRLAWNVPYPQLLSAVFVNGDRWVVTDQASFLRGVNSAQITSRVDLWDATTSRPVGEPIIVNGDAGDVEVDHPGGSRLASSTFASSGTYMIWDLDPADWASTACRIAGRNLTQDEWKEYLPDRPYQLTCPQWPAGP